MFACHHHESLILFSGLCCLKTKILNIQQGVVPVPEASDGSTGKCCSSSYCDGSTDECSLVLTFGIHYYIVKAVAPFAHIMPKNHFHVSIVAQGCSVWECARYHGLNMGSSTFFHPPLSLFMGL